MDKETIRQLLEKYGEYTLAKNFLDKIKEEYEVIQITDGYYTTVYYVPELDKEIQANE